MNGSTGGAGHASSGAPAGGRGRRAFLAGLATLPAAGVAAAVPAKAARPAPRLRLSCNLYSFNTPLRAGATSLEEVIDVCAELGFDAVDPTGYYFPGYPEPAAEAYVHRIKRRAFVDGLAISGTGVRNDFTLPDAVKRQQEVAHVGRWLAVAARLGAPVLRVFDGRSETAGPSREQRIDWVVDAFARCAALGEQQGVVVVYQNHDELLKTAAEVLAVHERVRSDWFGLDVDVGSLRTADPYEEAARLAPLARTWQIKERVYRRGIEEKTDARRLVAIVRESGYRGYLPLETLGPGDPRDKVRRWLDEVREALG